MAINLDVTGDSSLSGKLSLGGEFDMKTVDFGLRPPRLTRTQRDAMGAPLSGTAIVNTDDNVVQRFQDSNWQSEWPNINMQSTKGTVLSSNMMVETVGSVVLSTARAPDKDVSFKAGNASSYAFLPNTSLISMAPTMTVECVVQFTNTALCVVMGKMAPNSSMIHWTLSRDAVGKVLFSYWNGTSITVVTSTTSLVDTTKFHHIAVTIDGTYNFKLYIDGVQDATLSNVATMTATPTMLTMLRYNSTSYTNVNVQSMRLSQAVLYTGTFTPPIEYPLTTSANTVFVLSVPSKTTMTSDVSVSGNVSMLGSLSLGTKPASNSSTSDGMLALDESKRVRVSSAGGWNTLLETKTVLGNEPFPTLPLTTNTSVPGFTASASSNSANAFLVFDESTPTSWVSGATYNSTTGMPNGSVSTTGVTGFGTVLGEYVQLVSTTPMCLQTMQVKVNVSVNVSSNLMLLSSDDGGTTWTVLKNIVNAVWVGGTTLTLDIASNDVVGARFRLVVLKTASPTVAGTCSIQEIVTTGSYDSAIITQEPTSYVSFPNIDTATLSTLNVSTGTVMYDTTLGKIRDFNGTGWNDYSVNPLRSDLDAGDRSVTNISQILSAAEPSIGVLSTITGIVAPSIILAYGIYVINIPLVFTDQIRIYTVTPTLQYVTQFVTNLAENIISANIFVTLLFITSSAGNIRVYSLDTLPVAAPILVSSMVMSASRTYISTTILNRRIFTISRSGTDVFYEVWPVTINPAAMLINASVTYSSYTAMDNVLEVSRGFTGTFVAVNGTTRTLVSSQYNALTLALTSYTLSLGNVEIKDLIMANQFIHLLTANNTIMSVRATPALALIGTYSFAGLSGSVGMRRVGSALYLFGSSGSGGLSIYIDGSLNNASWTSIATYSVTNQSNAINDLNVFTINNTDLTQRLIPCINTGGITCGFGNFQTATSRYFESQAMSAEYMGAQAVAADYAIINELVIGHTGMAYRIQNVTGSTILAGTTCSPTGIVADPFSIGNMIMTVGPTPVAGTIFAGVAKQDIPNNAYGSIQQLGLAQLRYNSGPIIVGKSVSVNSNVAGTVEVVNLYTTGNIGYCLSSSAVDGKIWAFLLISEHK